ncbi:MAG: hypothetical protein ACPG6B_05540 [Oceanihabitans sp.]
MKLKYILPILFLAFLTTACSSDNDDDNRVVVDELEGLIKIQEISNNTHTIELYNKTGMFETGYNAISLRIKNIDDNTYVENATISWKPLMQMPTMQHSCPKSAITKKQGTTAVYQGYIIYQMTNTDSTGWALTIDYTIGEFTYTATNSISVLQSEKQNVTTFIGSDTIKYIVALIEPNQPIIGNNDLKVGLYKMENMMSFPQIADYSMELDPRMPGMGNHSSPNNTNLGYSLVDKMYHANLSLTMTGYWVLNLKLLNANGDLIKGEDVTDSNTQSSLYLELEF